MLKNFFWGYSEQWESTIHKDSIFEKEHIVIPTTTVPNDEVVVPLQHENAVVVTLTLINHQLISYMLTLD